MAGADYLAMLGKQGLSAATAAHQSAAQRKWDEYTYRHRYQWQVEDMIKAGLNPLLAATQGAPVPHSTPAQKIDFGSLDLKPTSAKAAVIALQQAKENLELTKWQTFHEKQKADKTANESDSIAYDMWKKKGSIHETIESSRLSPIEKRAAIAELNARAAMHSARAANERAVLPASQIQGSAVGGWLNVLNSAARAANSIRR